MADDNKQNIQYFEASSMRELYDVLHTWQLENGKRFLSLNIDKKDDKFCCIALTNPMEVIIQDASWSGAHVSEGALWVRMM